MTCDDVARTGLAVFPVGGFYKDVAPTVLAADRASAYGMPRPPILDAPWDGEPGSPPGHVDCGGKRSAAPVWDGSHVPKAVSVLRFATAVQNIADSLRFMESPM